jgi:hypothetical protein
MGIEDTDRRRFFLLGILTVIALPAIYLVSRGDLSGTIDAGDPTAVDGALGTEPNSPNRPAIELSEKEPTFLDGPAPNDVLAVSEIAVPERPQNPPVQLNASYRSSIRPTSTCFVKPGSGVRAGVTVTVKNLDNARTVSCRTTPGPEGQAVDVVLHTDSFLDLADPTEAPIIVELTSE